MMGRRRGGVRLGFREKKEGGAGGRDICEILDLDLSNDILGGGGIITVKRGDLTFSTVG